MENLPTIIDETMKNSKLTINNVNLIMPTKTFGQLIGPFEKISVEIVKINPDPKEGEVFELGGKKSFTKIALLKIGNALRIVWDPERTCIIESTARKSRARAVGAIMTSNGKPIVFSDEKTVDIDVIEEEQRISIEEEAEKGKIVEWKTTNNNKKYPVFGPWDSEHEKQKYIELKVRKAILQYKKFKDERAMTGAKERVIRGLIALKSSYTDMELSKPFVLPHIVQDIDAMLSIPDIRAEYIRNMTSTASAVFGNENRNQTIKPQVKQIECEPERLPEENGNTLTIIPESENIDAIANKAFSAEDDPFFVDDRITVFDELFKTAEKEKNIHLSYILGYIKEKELIPQAFDILQDFESAVEEKKLIKIIMLYCLTDKIMNYKIEGTGQDLNEYLDKEIKTANKKRLEDLIRSCYNLMMKGV